VRPSVFIITAIACALSSGAWAQTHSPTAQPAPQAEPTPAPSAGTPNPAVPAEPTPEQRELARSAYTQGQALFAEGKYSEAKSAFEQAHAALPNPVVLMSIAECDARLGNLEGAYATYQRYLADRPDAPDRADVEQKIAELAATPATLSLTSVPAGASIVIDGKPTGKTTPTSLPIARGDHQIEILLAGYETNRLSVAARLGARHELEIVLKPLPPPPPVAPPPSTVTVSDTGSPEAALWITGIVGAAGIVTGSVLGFLTLAEQSDFDSHPTASSADSGERLALFTDVAFGVGAMALVTGAVLLFTSGGKVEKEPAAQPQAHFELVPGASPRGASVVARARF
jgi:tetratricopeptide (TPR) repeat protein